MTRVAALLALISSGCALNGVLEIDMQLPYIDSTGDKPFALVEIARGPIPESFNPDGRGPITFNFDLGDNLCEVGEEACNVRLSVTTEDTSMEALHIRASLCDTEGCNGSIMFPDDSRAPYYLFQINRPFYQGHRTFWHPTRGPFEPLYAPLFADQPSGRYAERRIEAHRCEVSCEKNRGDDPFPDMGYCETDPDRPACSDLSCRGQHACE